MLQVLMKVVEGTTVDDAVNIMNEAHLNGMAMVTQCTQVRHSPPLPPTFLACLQPLSAVAVVAAAWLSWDWLSCPLQ